MLSILYLLISGVPGTDLIPHSLVTTLTLDPPILSHRHSLHITTMTTKTSRLPRKHNAPGDTDVLSLEFPLLAASQFTAIYFSSSWRNKDRPD